MATPRDHLLDHFPEEPPEPLDYQPITEAGKRRRARQLQDEELAAWCILTAQSPATYLTLTRDQRAAFADVARRLRGRH